MLVGRGRELELISRSQVSATLGRHTNDHMVSFYVQTPSGFDVVNTHSSTDTWLAALACCAFGARRRPRQDERGTSERDQSDH